MWLPIIQVIIYYSLPELKYDKALSTPISFNFLKEKAVKAGTQIDICTPMFVADNIEKVEAPKQVLINRWMEKQMWYVHTHSRILFSLQKEGNPITYYNMDETWHYAQ